MAIAIKPFVGDIPKKPEFSVSPIPPFPLSGTTYQGYFRDDPFDDKFQLRKQIPFSQTFDVGNTNEQLTTARTFVTDITFMSSGISGAGTSGQPMRLIDGGASGTRKWAGRIRNGGAEFAASFLTALQFPNGLYLQLETAGVTGDFGLTVVGFTEE